MKTAEKEAEEKTKKSSEYQLKSEATWSKFRFQFAFWLMQYSI
jgi:hypothetical protein